jgi:hypothetical protein
MTAQTDPYVRVYYRILSDDRFEHVYEDDAALATWLRLLLIADGAFPAPAHLPRKTDDAALEKLAAAGLVELLPRSLYRSHGLAAERDHRSEAATFAADVRHHGPEKAKALQAARTAAKEQEPSVSSAPALPAQSVSNADPMPLRATPSNSEQAPTATALPKPRANSPTNEPRLTEHQLNSWNGFGPRWARFKEAWLSRGLLYAPFGSPDDDDTSQRGLLFQVLDTRPNDIVRWVEQAPKPSAREVITYILEQWHEARAAAGVDDDEWEEAKVNDRRESIGSMTRIGELLATVPEPERAA